MRVGPDPYIRPQSPSKTSVFRRAPRQLLPHGEVGTLGADFSPASNEIKALGAFFCNFSARGIWTLPRPFLNRLHFNYLHMFLNVDYELARVHFEGSCDRRNVLQLKTLFWSLNALPKYPCRRPGHRFLRPRDRKWRLHSRARRHCRGLPPRDRYLPLNTYTCRVPPNPVRKSRGVA